MNSSEQNRFDIKSGDFKKEFPTEPAFTYSGTVLKGLFMWERPKTSGTGSHPILTPPLI